jgi:hypothetical protein
LARSILDLAASRNHQLPLRVVVVKKLNHNDTQKAAGQGVADFGVFLSPPP